MGENNKIVETSYEDVIKPKYFTVSDASKKLNISTTKINHWIFKLNKSKSNFFSNTNKLTEDDLDKIALAQSLHDEGSSFEEIVNYFTDESNTLINKDNNSIKTDLTKLDSQVLSKALTMEVEKNINKLIETLENDFTDRITEKFRQQASNIAGSSLKAIEKTKDAMLSEVIELRKQNDMFKSEIERMYSNQTEELRKKLEEKEKNIKELEKQKNKSWFSKIFKR